MKKKIIMGIIIFIILIIIGISIYVYFDIQEKKNTIDITINNDIVCNYGESKQVSEYITSISGTYEDFTINCDNIGEKKVKLDFINQYEYPVSYLFAIRVVDNVKPTIMSGNSYTVTVGSNVDLTKKLISFDDLDDCPQREIIGDYDLNKVGSYKLTYKVTDNFGNSTSKDFTLYVKNKTSNNTNNNVTKISYNSLHDKYKNEHTLIGLDVSKWQGDINFDLLPRNLDFVMIKFGGTNGIGKDFYIDSKFKRNIEGFTKLGIPVGLYYYSHARTKEEAIKEANYLLENIKDYKITLPIAFDWENWSNFNNYDMSLKTLNDTKDAFIKTINDAGYKGVLYSSKNYLLKYWHEDDAVWLAHYTIQTDYQGKYFMWQRTSSCSITGITDNTVDFNILYKNNYEGNL